MLISKSMNAALNEQVGNELAASNQYVAIAAWFDGEGLPHIAKHFFAQAAEERDHAMRFVRYPWKPWRTIWNTFRRPSAGST